MKRKLISLLIILSIVFTMGIGFPSHAEAASKAPSKYTWSEKKAPNYVVTVGKARVSGKPQKGKINYSRLDKYGRTRRVVGNITYKMVKASAGWREDFAPGSDPAGWGRNKIVKIRLYTGKYYRGYIWNRSHLIADSLGGRAIRRNLITGTRMQNVGANDGLGGMAYAERKCVSFLYKHKKANIYYSARPIYKGKELLPRSVVVDFKSYGPSGRDRLNERVIVYNAAKGFRINYKKGTATKSKTAVRATKTGKDAKDTSSGSDKSSGSKDTGDPNASDSASAGSEGDPDASDSTSAGQADDPDTSDITSSGQVDDPDTPGTTTSGSEDSQEDASPADTQTGSDADIVFTTRSGKRYHLTRDCSGLANAAAIYEKTIEDAVAEGLTLCSICASNQKSENEN